jgi:hypothetical protein
VYKGVAERGSRTKGGRGGGLKSEKKLCPKELWMVLLEFKMCLSCCTSSYSCLASGVLMGDTQFHIACMDYQFVPHNWTCPSCRSNSTKCRRESVLTCKLLMLKVMFWLQKTSLKTYHIRKLVGSLFFLSLAFAAQQQLAVVQRYSL